LFNSDMGGIKYSIKMNLRYFFIFSFMWLLAGKAAAQDTAGMVAVPRGEFEMGSDSSGKKAERPRHKVLLGAYFIDARPVTAGELTIFLNSRLPLEGGSVQAPPDRRGVLGELEAPEEIKNFIQIPGAWIVLRAEGLSLRGSSGSEEAFNVSWQGADAYCRARGKRLPTEAEWEKACEGGGKEFVIGKKLEWTLDWYAKDFYKPGPAVDPLNAFITGQRTARGGADLKGRVRCASRSGIPPHRKALNLGFRCASGAVKE